MKLSKNFWRHEFACKCGCGFDTVDAALLELLQEVRDHFNAALPPISCCRCASHNKSVGGAPSSQHLIGRACDFYVEGVDSRTVYEFINTRYPDSLGLAHSPTSVHVDTRSGPPARWVF